MALQLAVPFVGESPFHPMTKMITVCFDRFRELLGQQISSHQSGPKRQITSLTAAIASSYTSRSQMMVKQRAWMSVR